MRGLKHKWLNQQEEQHPVASFTDAWIETVDSTTIFQPQSVASFTDAWIETVPPADVAGPIMSHLLQMRGLKLLQLIRNQCHNKSHLLQMRGLKQICHRIKSGSRSRIFYRCVD